MAGFKLRVRGNPLSALSAKAVVKFSFRQSALITRRRRKLVTPAPVLELFGSRSHECQRDRPAADAARVHREDGAKRKMKVTKRTVVFEKLDHTPPLRIVQHDWEKDAEDEKRERQSVQQIGMIVFNLPKSGSRLVVEVARTRNAMDELVWTELAIA